MARHVQAKHRWIWRAVKGRPPWAVPVWRKRTDLVAGVENGDTTGDFVTDGRQTVELT
jgi:hypothetical protein